MSNHVVSLAGQFSFREWVTDLLKSLPTSNIPLLVEEDWKKWVMDFITLNPTYIITLPTQKTWQEWGTFFINDVNRM